MELRPIDREAAALLLAQRWAALAVSGPDGPGASMVAYAVEPSAGSLLLFLSGLAAHTAVLRESGRAAIVISVPDAGAGDPQELPRLSIEAVAAALPRDSEDFAAAWEVYASRFPAAAGRLALADFSLFRLSPTAARYVGGFARAAPVSPDRLAAALEAAG